MFKAFTVEAVHAGTWKCARTGECARTTPSLTSPCSPACCATCPFACLSTSGNPPTLTQVGVGGLWRAPRASSSGVSMPGQRTCQVHPHEGRSGGGDVHDEHGWDGDEHPQRLGGRWDVVRMAGPHQAPPSWTLRSCHLIRDYSSWQQQAGSSMMMPSTVTTHLHRPVRKQNGRLALHLVKARLLRAARQAAAERCRPAPPFSCICCASGCKLVVQQGARYRARCPSLPGPPRPPCGCAAPRMCPGATSRCPPGRWQAAAHERGRRRVRVGVSRTIGRGGWGWGWGIGRSTTTRFGTAAPVRLPHRGLACFPGTRPGQGATSHTRGELARALRGVRASDRAREPAVSVAKDTLPSRSQNFSVCGPGATAQDEGWVEGGGQQWCGEGWRGGGAPIRPCTWMMSSPLICAAQPACPAPRSSLRP